VACATLPFVSAKGHELPVKSCSQLAQEEENDQLENMTLMTSLLWSHRLAD
jgi:hypothetical protein